MTVGTDCRFFTRQETSITQLSQKNEYIENNISCGGRALQAQWLITEMDILKLSVNMMFIRMPFRLYALPVPNVP
jgi:hypothetical protein